MNSLNLSPWSDVSASQGALSFSNSRANYASISDHSTFVPGSILFANQMASSSHVHYAHVSGYSAKKAKF